MEAASGLSSGLFDLKPDKFLVFGDLHANLKRFASACEEAGADAVVLHLNENSAQGRFGGLEIEGDSIKDCLSVLKIPAGVAIGDSRPLVNDEWEMCVGLGFAFVEMLAHQLPTFVWKDSRVSKLVSIGPGYILEQVKSLSEFEGVSGIVASLTSAHGYGLSMTLFDVATLKLIASLSKKPVLYPTQRSIRPHDVQTLREQGCKGLLVNNSIYGSTPESCREGISNFRTAINHNDQVPTP